MKTLIYTLIAILLPVFSIGQTTWTGTTDTDWNTATNWDTGIIPIAATLVIIPDGLLRYPIINGTAAICTNLTIGSAATVTLASTGNLTVSGTLTNDAGTSGILIQSDASGTGSLIHSTAGVNATTEMFLRGEQWHYISTPINGVNSAEFNISNFKKWDATMVWAGGTNSDPWMDHLSTTMANGQGYANYEAQNTTSLTGTLNEGLYDVTVSKSVTTINPDDQGWNLVGNPYSSAIDWTQIDYVSANLDYAIYCYTGIQYASWVGGVSTNGGTQYIPQGQGFFVKCNNTSGGTLTFNNDDRVHNSQSLWKDAKETSGLIKLIAQGNGFSDETLVRFMEGATDEFDGSYDAYKLLSSNPDVPQIYSLNNAKTTKYSINSLPKISDEIIIPLGFLVTTPGTYSISPSEMSIDAEYVYLEDAVTASVIDLTKYPTYIFTYPGDVAADENRFILRIIPKSSEINKIEFTEFQLYPNPSNGIVNFKTENKNNLPISIEIYDISGKKVHSINYNSGNNLEVLDLSDLSKGVYTVKINLEDKSAFRKLILMK